MEQQATEQLMAASLAKTVAILSLASATGILLALPAENDDVDVGVAVSVVDGFKDLAAHFW